ncbi:mitochondrial metal transporter 2 [Fusarium coicis]|nr:mitochondrial metal transporter 2 [Fusarium coicis]
MSLPQAGRPTGAGVGVGAGVTSPIAGFGPGAGARATHSHNQTSRGFASWGHGHGHINGHPNVHISQQPKYRGQMSLLRPNIATPHVACLRLRLRALQKASIVAALSTCAYLSASSKLSSYHVSDTASVARPSTNSLPHLAPFRSKLRSPPSLVQTSMSQIRSHTGQGQGHDHKDGHNHSHGHDHSHSHGILGHHHHHDNAYLTSGNKDDPGVRITRIGLVSNLGMAIAKFAGGWAFNSKAMTADAWHSITDLASDILTLATVTWSLKPPTDKFPMGFGKVESLGSLGVSSMLLAGGLYMGWDSGISLYGHFYPEAAHGILEHVGHGHSHSHGAAALGIPSMHAAWLAAGTILIKEWLYHATMKVARERKSSVLASNAIHHRVDSLTGFVTLAAIMGANAMENAAWLDPVGGLLISIMVIQAGAGNTVAAFRELADQGIDDEIKSSVTKQANKALKNVVEGHQVALSEVSGIKSGQNYLVDLEMTVPGAWSVDTTQQVENAVRTQVGGKVRGVRRVRIRFSPKEATAKARFDDFIPGTVVLPPETEEDASEAEGESNHNHEHHEHHDHKSSGHVHEPNGSHEQGDGLRNRNKQ